MSSCKHGSWWCTGLRLTLLLCLVNNSDRLQRCQCTLFSGKTSVTWCRISLCMAAQQAACPLVYLPWLCSTFQLPSHPIVVNEIEGSFSRFYSPPELCSFCCYQRQKYYRGRPCECYGALVKRELSSVRCHPLYYLVAITCTSLVSRGGGIGAGIIKTPGPFVLNGKTQHKWGELCFGALTLMYIYDIL